VREEKILSDTIRIPTAADYSALGYVANPFATIDESGSEPYWMRLVTRAAANRLLAATHRARRRSGPVLVSMVEDIPEYYYRRAQNDFLGRMADDPSLDTMALSIPLDIMRLGRIRGTIAELAELVVAVDLPTTLAAWFARELVAPDSEIPESGLVTADELAEAAAAFATDPKSAVERYIGVHREPVSMNEMDAVVHEAYMRQLGQPVEVEKDDEGTEAGPALVEHVPNETEDSGPEPDPDAGIREYLVALMRVHLSPVLARALVAWSRYGESLAAQEMKVTKAPRKTLAAILRLMNARWGTVAVIYDNFTAWPNLDQQTKMDVLASLTELRWLVADTGVMIVAVVKGESPELEEQFAAAEQVDWTMPELTPLYNGDLSLDLGRVQAWLDAASVSGSSPVRADGPELATLVAAAGHDLGTFCAMAENAFRDAASRGASRLDADAIAAGLASAKTGASD
jgi:hypothetical protein